MDRASLFSFKPEPAKLDNGQTVYLRRITSAERLAYIAFVTAEQPDKPDDAPNAKWVELAAHRKHRLLCLTLCDEQGARLYPDGADAQLGQEVDGVSVEQLAEHAERVNGLGGKAPEDAGKNSPTPASSG